MDKLQELMVNQYKKYPQMQLEDMVKLIYQNEFGCGHMISDEAKSLVRISEEAAGLRAEQLEGENWEPIGEGLARLHLRILKQGTLKPETLNRMFTLTANREKGSAEGFEKKTALLADLCNGGILPFDSEKVTKLPEEYRAAGYPSVSHSSRYRLNYVPAYRVVDERFCKFIQLFCRIDNLMQEKGRLNIAVDGNSGAGKTTLAAMLKSVYDCNLFAMDDFFLQPGQRTPTRLKEPGGNVDYERFGQEVLEPLLTGKAFAYRPYDCSLQKLSSEVAVSPKALNIVEGVYSLHPLLAGAYDLKVFMEINEEMQALRLIARSKEMYPRFVKEWIPMESKYFNELKIKSQCDLIYCDM